MEKTKVSWEVNNLLNNMNQETVTTFEEHFISYYYKYSVKVNDITIKVIAGTEDKT